MVDESGAQSGQGISDNNSVLHRSALVREVQDSSSLQRLWRRFEEDEVVCRQGDPAGCLWVIVKGRIAVRTTEGKTIIDREVGEVVGEQAILEDNGRRGADLVAYGGPAEVLEISRADIDAHKEAAQLWKNCARILSKKLNQATEQRSEKNRESREVHRLMKVYIGEHALSMWKLVPEKFFKAHQTERVVIWFSDISGFSQHASRMSPEKAAEFVQSFLGPQVSAITEGAGRGFIDKFIGDAVMAYWLTSSVGREECLAALGAAEFVVDKIQKIQIGSSPLGIRIGLHIGEVSAGNFGTPSRSQFTLIGKEVNKAARLEQAREDGLGEIRVSPEFYGLLPPEAQERLPKPVEAHLKNIGDDVIYTNESRLGG